jgi:hypothetical protein
VAVTVAVLVVGKYTRGLQQSPKVKVKFSLERAMKAQRGRGGIALLFL